MLKEIYHYLVILRSGLFDRAYYLKAYPDVRKADIDSLWHFIRIGWKEERNPSGKFDTNYYLKIYPDVKESQLNPLIHYIKFGITEDRFTYKENNSTIIAKRNYQQFINDIPRVSNGFVFISHDASLTGAPINLLHICKAYKEFHGNNFLIITLKGGPIFHQFQEIGNALNLDLDVYGIIEDKSVEGLLSEINTLGYRNCIANSVISGKLSYLLKKLGFNSIYLIHELPDTIEALDYIEVAKEISASNSDVIFAANYVAEKFISKDPRSLLRGFQEPFPTAPIVHFLGPSDTVYTDE